MYKLYSWTTPNGQKPAILLEELKVPYEIIPVNITDNEQFTREYKRINPNSKIPALVNNDITLFESGAIMQYLADKHGQFLATAGQERATTLSWCNWQMAGLGPMIGQWAHFQMLDEEIPYAINRYLTESIRLLNVLDQRLKESNFLAGENYSIADMMSYTWAKGGLEYIDRLAPGDSPELPNVKRWIDTISERPAVKTAMRKLTKAVDQYLKV